MERLRWVFDLVDRVTGPAKTMSSALQRVRDLLGQLNKDAGGYSKSAGSFLTTLAGLATGAAKPFAAILGPLAAVTGFFDPAISAAKLMVGTVAALEVALLAAAGAFVNFGLEQVQFQENTLQSFRMLSGLKGDEAKGAAEDLFQRSIAFGQLSPLDTRQSIETIQRLRSSFTQKQTETLYAGLSDIVAMSGTGDQGAKSLVTALSQIKGAGSLKGQDLLQVLNVSSLAGIGRMQIGAEVGKLKKVSAAAGAQMLEGGILKADEAILAILNAVREKTGMALGKYAADQADNLSGAIINLKGRFEELFLTTRNLAELPGVGLLKDLINGLSEALKTTSASGKRLQESVVGAFDAILRTVAGDRLFDGERMVQTVDSLSTAIQQLGAVVQVSLSGIFGLVDGLTVGLGLGKEFMGGPFDPAKVVVVAERFRALGETIGGLAAKVINFFKPVMDFLDRLMNGETLGALTLATKGANMALNPLASIANGIGESLFGPAEPIAAGASDNSRSQVNNITVNVSGSQAQADIDRANEVADKVARRVPSHLNF